MIVQRLGKDDAGLLLKLNALFGAVFEEEDTYGGNPPSADYLSRVLGRDEVVALAAIDSGEIVGGLVAYELQKLEQERSEFYIYDLAVREDRRRIGVATALIDELRAIAAAANGWVVLVQADHGDDPAIALYTKLGRREDVLHFDIDVG